MTTQTEALKLALDALEVCEQHGYIPVRSTRDAITAIKETLAQPDQYAKGYADAMNWKTANHLEHLPAKPEQPKEHDFKAVYEMHLELSEPQRKEPEQRSVSEHLEPVGTLSVFEDTESDLGWSYDISANLEQHKKLRDMNGAKIYTTPPHRKPLTESERFQLRFQWDPEVHGAMHDYIIQQTEAAHGIKE